MNVNEAFKEFQNIQKEIYSQEIEMDSTYEVKRFIRDERKRQGIKQIDFAKKIEKPISFVADFERGQIANPSIERLNTYLNGLGYKLNIKVEKI